MADEDKFRPHVVIVEDEDGKLEKHYMESRADAIDCASDLMLEDLCNRIYNRNFRVVPTDLAEYITTLRSLNP